MFKFFVFNLSILYIKNQSPILIYKEKLIFNLMLMNFNDFNESISEEISLDDIYIKVDNSSNEFLNTIKSDLSLLIYKRTLKHIRPKKITGHLQQEELHTKKKNRSTLNISMNNGDIIIGTYNTLSYNISITINNEILYDIKFKTCDDNKLLEKMISEYKKYLKNKGYQIKNDNKKDE